MLAGSREFFFEPRLLSQAFMQAGVLECEADELRNVLKKLAILFGDGLLPIQEFQYTNDFTVIVLDRQREDILRLIAEHSIEFRIETRVLIRIRHVLSLA